MEYLERLLRRARAIHSGPPVPTQRKMSDEIELPSVATQPEENGDGLDYDTELEFEND